MNRRLTGCAVLFVLLFAPFAFAQEAVQPLENYIPADSIMHGYYQGLAQAGPAFKGTAVVDMLREPEFQAFGDEIARFTDLALGQNLPDPNLARWKDVRAVLDCQILFIAVPVGDDEVRPVIIIRPNGKRDDLKNFLDRILTIVGPGKLTSDGVDFQIFSEVHIAWLGNDLLLAQGRQTALRVIRTMRGELPSLASDPVFIKLRKKVSPSPEFLRFYVDVDALLKQGLKTNPDPNAAAAIEKLGINAFSKLYASVTPDAPGVKTRIYGYMPKGIRGVWKAVPHEGIDEARLLADMPGNTSSFVVMRLPLGDVVDALNLVLSMGTQRTINDIVKEQVGFDLLGDIARSIDDQIVCRTTGPGFVVVPEFVVTVGVKDKAACRATLDKLLAFLSSVKGKEDAGELAGRTILGMDRIEYKGATIDVVKFIGVPMMFSPSAMIVDERLVIGPVPQTLKKCIDHPAKGSTDLSPGILQNRFFTDSRSHVAPRPAFLAYSDSRQGVAASYGGFITFLAQCINGVPQLPPNNLATRLPSVDAVAPHLLASVTAVSFDGEGFMCESYDTLGGLTSLASGDPVGVSQIGILAGFLLPALSQGQESARRTACLNNERQIILALIQYAGEHNDKYPDSFAPLLKERFLNTPKVFICPSQGGGQNLAAFIKGPIADMPLDELKKIDDLSSYILVKGVTHADDANTIVVFEKKPHQNSGRNCAFNDGRVQFIPEPQFQKMLKDQEDRFAKDRGN